MISPTTPKTSQSRENSPSTKPGAVQIALFSPDQVHHGTWHEAWTQRDATQQAYYERHPERFRRPPSTPTPADIVGINLKQDSETDTKRLQPA